MPSPVAPPTATVPGPFGQVAATWSFVRDPLSGMQEIQRRWGDIVVTYAPGQTFVQVSDPAEATRILRDLRDGTIKDFGTRVLSEVLGQGLLTNEGASWRRQRVLVAPSFRPSEIAGHARAFSACAARAAAGFPLGPSVDVHGPCSRLTLDILSETVFGGDLPLDAARVERCLSRVMATFHRLTASWEAMLPPALQRRVMRALHAEKAELDSIVTDLIARRRALGTGGADLLSRLIEARDDAGRGMDDRQLADEVLTLLLAGHETTALALSYALWCLAARPECQERVRAEVRALDGPPAADAASRLPYTKAVILESMRLYPPAWMIGRELTAPAEVGGRRFEAGTQVLIPIWLLHRDGRSFPEPERFAPERWLDGTAQGAPKGAYLPFGDGPRVCVGQHFAMLEAVIGLAVLMGALQVAPAPNARLALLPSITLRPRAGVLLAVARA
jgi:cytochrome P450